VIVLSCLLSFARISALHNHYHAPFNVFHHLQVYELPRLAVTVQPELAPDVDATLPHAEFAKSLERDRALPLDGLVPLDLRLCIGKEWHRYPSSWLVPDEVEPRFIKSAFDGILPKGWEAPGKGKGLFDRATATVPSGMNMYNREEADRYVRPRFGLSFFEPPAARMLTWRRNARTQVDISTCDYLVDVDFPARSNSPLEPRYVNDSEHWDRAFCHPFLDAETSPRLTRAVNLPLPGWNKRNNWGEYCLLRRKGLYKDSRAKLLL
jgi:alpha-1,2-mannosyltransferase